MRRSIRVLVALMVFGFGATAEAATETWTYFFDCNQNFVGWSLVDQCAHTNASSGQQYGAYKAVDTMDCNGGTVISGQWYYWDGSNWVAFSGPPGPNC